MGKVEYVMKIQDIYCPADYIQTMRKINKSDCKHGLKYTSHIFSQNIDAYDALNSVHYGYEVGRYRCL